jgi:hypothetical protein
MNGALQPPTSNTTRDHILFIHAGSIPTCLSGSLYFLSELHSLYCRRRGREGGPRPQPQAEELRYHAHMPHDTPNPALHVAGVVDSLYSRQAACRRNPTTDRPFFSHSSSNYGSSYNTTEGLREGGRRSEGVCLGQVPASCMPC